MAIKQPPIVTFTGLHISPAPKHTISVLSNLDVRVINDLYSPLYPSFCQELNSGNIELPSSFQMMEFIYMKGQKLESNAYYLAENVLPFDSPAPMITHTGITDRTQQKSRPARVLYYSIHCFVPLRSSTPVVTALACVLWPQHHPDRLCIGKPVEVWCLNLFESTSRNRFIPVDILCPVLHSESNLSLSGERVLVTVPIVF